MADDPDETTRPGDGLSWDAPGFEPPDRPKPQTTAQVVGRGPMCFMYYDKHGNQIDQSTFLLLSILDELKAIRSLLENEHVES